MGSLRHVMLAVLPLCLALASLPARAADITIFAAASLKDALGEIERNWSAETGHHAAISFAASSVLARQIEASGGADMFVSADLDWMDYLDQRNLIEKRSRHDLLGNHLVLVEPASQHLEITVKPRFQLRAALGGGRLALADPDAVPAGKYAKAALMYLGVWNGVSNELAKAENVRAALEFVARGETPLGIVYTTDALSEPRVRIAGTFPDFTHPPIVYPVALMRGASPLAWQFLGYLEGPRARSVFEKDGFIVPPLSR